MNMHRKIRVGGELGAELERMLAEIRANQIKTSPGVKVNRTPNGTTLSVGQAQVGAAVQSSVTGAAQGKFLYDPHLPTNTPRTDNNGQTPFQQLALWFDVDGVEQLVIMPPKNQSQGGFGHTVNDHWSFDGQFWPQTLRTAPSGRGWYFTKQLNKNDSYAIQRLNSLLPVTSVIATLQPTGLPPAAATIKYMMKPMPPDPLNPYIVDDWSWDSGP